MFEAVIFDWDGTLADTRRVIVLSLKKALSENNYNVTNEYIERRIGIGAAETFREIIWSANGHFDEELVERLIERKNAFEIELIGEVELFEGARELLEALQGKIKIGLASMNNWAVIESMLKSKNLQDCFETILTAESVSRSKPDPEIFLKCASKLTSPPEGCVVVEDSIFGVKAAKSANMGCIAVLTGVYSEMELEKQKPDLIVKTLNDSRVLSFILQS
jgi:HAD superfamily hydrolase (TIGR01509 family)